VVPHLRGRRNGGPPFAASGEEISLAPGPPWRGPGAAPAPACFRGCAAQTGADRSPDWRPAAAALTWPCQTSHPVVILPAAPRPCPLSFPLRTRYQPTRPSPCATATASPPPRALSARASRRPPLPRACPARRCNGRCAAGTARARRRSPRRWWPNWRSSWSSGCVLSHLVPFRRGVSCP
jgi:hypothetical protein